MDPIVNVIVLSVQKLLETFGVKVQSHSASTIKWLVGMINDFSSDIWSEPIIMGLMDFIGTIGLVIFVYSLLLLLGDIGKQIDSVDWKTVIITLGEALFYVLTIRYIGMILFSSAELFIISFNMDIDAESLVMGDLMVGGPVILQDLVLVIIMAVFFVMNFYRVGCMIVHLIASVLYIPFIVRGDVEKITEWLTIAISIAVTYTIQFIAMYFAISLWNNFQLHLAIIAIMVAFCVGSALQRFGYNTGAKSGMMALTRSAMTMAHGASMLMK